MVMESEQQRRCTAEVTIRRLKNAVDLTAQLTNYDGLTPKEAKEPWKQSGDLIT